MVNFKVGFDEDLRLSQLAKISIGITLVLGNSMGMPRPGHLLVLLPERPRRGGGFVFPQAKGL